MNTCQLCNESLKTVMEMEGDICATCSVKLLPKDMKDSFVSRFKGKALVESYAPDTVDFKTEIAKFKDGPDRVLMLSTLAHGESLNLQFLSDSILHESSGIQLMKIRL